MAVEEDKRKKDVRKKKKSDFEALHQRCLAAGKEELEDPDFSSNDESSLPPGGTVDDAHFPSESST